MPNLDELDANHWTVGAEHTIAKAIATLLGISYDENYWQYVEPDEDSVHARNVATVALAAMMRAGLTSVSMEDLGEYGVEFTEEADRLAGASCSAR